MDFLFTFEPSTILVFRSIHIKIYFNIQSSESWIIFGECNLCGECIEGAMNPDMNMRPYNKRKDIVVRPEIGTKMANCTLRGEYL